MTVGAASDKVTRPVYQGMSVVSVDVAASARGVRYAGPVGPAGRGGPARLVAGDGLPRTKAPHGPQESRPAGGTYLKPRRGLDIRPDAAGAAARPSIIRSGRLEGDTFGPIHATRVRGTTMT